MGHPAADSSGTLPRHTQGFPSEKSSILPAGLVAELLQEFLTLADRLAVRSREEPALVALPEPSDRLGGYRLAGIEPRFLADDGSGGRAPRSLARALPGEQAPGDRAADELDRLELVRLVGTTLESLHAEELFTAGIGLDSFAYALDPRPAVMLLESDGVRRVGGEFLKRTSSPERTEDSFDSDRYEFALLAHRLLVDPRPDASPDLYRHEHVPGLTPQQDRQVWGLWERAAGPSGTRPQIGEWMGVLHP